MSNTLVIGYKTYTKQGLKKWKELSPTDVIDKVGVRTNQDGIQVPITTNDLMLFVQQEAGDEVEVEEDVSCDSTFMLEKIPEIGEALRDAPRDETIYLFMDNGSFPGRLNSV